MTRDRLITAGLLVGIILVIVAFYARFVNNYFAYDDFVLMEHVLHGPAKVLRGYNNILRVVANLFFWPLSWFSWFDPLGFNLFSIGLLCLNALLLFFFARQLIGSQTQAALCALMFAGSSVGCDAIFWKAAYATQLNLFFYLATLMAYHRYRTTGRTVLYGVSTGIFLLAMLSKEEAASIPFLIILMELLILRSRLDWQVIRRTVPYAAIIVLYMVVNYILIYHLFKGESELVKHSAFRPLHTLLSPWTVFFISPEGRITGTGLATVATGIALAAALLFTRDRRVMLFGIGWVFFAFLPQSFSSLSEYDPKYIFNSISRHLYLPSVGASIVVSSLLMQLRERLPFGRIAVIVLIAGHLLFHYGRVQERGRQWGEEGVPVKAYYEELAKVLPRIPPNTHFYINSPPTGRAYMQLSMRTFSANASL